MLTTVFDYEASVQLLIARVKSMHESPWSPTPEKNRLTEASAKINEMADLIDGQWYDLEDDFDYDPPERNSNGYRIEPEFSNAGRFKGLIWELRKLAELASKEAADLPNSRKKHTEPFAAMGLLHIMYEAEKDKPTLYDESRDVQELNQILGSAGIHLSVERVRGLLSEALKKFDRSCGFYDEFFVFKQ